MAAPNGPPRNPLVSSGQTILFLGDHTSPDAPGYVSLVREVVGRFHPELDLRLISAGSPGQSAAGLRSDAMMQLLTSSRPDWLVIGLGLADALREPAVRRSFEDLARADNDTARAQLDATFGPEIETGPRDSMPAPEIANLEAFAANLHSAVSRLQDAGVHVALLTTILLGNSAEHPANAVVSAYNRAIRDEARASSAVLVDVEAAFRDVFDRAEKYKQKVVLTGRGGELNAQGQALVARALLAGLGLLPSRHGGGR
jgi:lysophospholipase L1-like esterase